MFKKVLIILLVLFILMILPRPSKSESNSFIVVNKYTQEEFQTKRIKINEDDKSISFDAICPKKKSKICKKVINGNIKDHLVYSNNELVHPLIK